ncbi:putative dehydrogenase [Thermosporothrix hazakensis]|jgi:predicted dehydrogenase|uniref:Oxidoreductase n=2 Tax=Thermosporothrix TaxID=768650 RepID=A0A455SYV5_9CHLR|nr:Gfo/Idh/MocA family oxidoreductase [Thermosporothrix hazakensis]PZW30570.1 putative dehydrogenase [Thermosporothrix hazakensis]BBH91285.1 oxidoreductase [Thermosporothrix sp. COM3]GCE49432.1 oxidoreductase [Thermosporothrix hazakensis]
MQGMKREFIRWGILGTAQISIRAVAPAIQASTNGRLVAVASRDPQKAADLYSFVPGLRIYADYQELLDDPAIDAVYIPLPNSLHAEWAIKAAEAGKHVLCEKPLAVTVEEAKEMIEAAEEHNVLLMEAFMYRFHPQIQWALKQIHAGEIGQIKLVRASFTIDIRDEPENIRLKPELAGGSLVDLGCYAVNLCHAVYGQAPRSVSARVHVVKPGGVDLAMAAILDYGEGRYGLIDSGFEGPRRQSVEIVGDLGTLTIPVPFAIRNMEGIVFAMKNGQMAERNFPMVDQYQLQVEHFAECVLTGKEPERSLSESLENLATIEAIYEAAGHDWPIL